MNSTQLFLCKHIEEEPADFTYLGIGSAPCLLSDGILDAKHDQLIPIGLNETIFRQGKTSRIIHYDPRFEDNLEFLTTYFHKNINLIPIDMAGGYRWISDTLDVIVISDKLEHEKDFPFFHHLCETILNTKGKLVIQEYTGYELQGLNKKLFEHSSQKDKYKCRILLDMTFGTDQGCSTDMTTIQPYYDYNGNFLNFYFLEPEGIQRWVGISLKLDDILKRKYRGLFLQTLNTVHVDYRRKLKGDTLMYGSPFYNETSTPEEIMTILQRQLREFFEVLLALRLVSKQEKHFMNELFAAYHTYDPYKWYDAVNKLVTQP